MHTARLVKVIKERSVEVTRPKGSMRDLPIILAAH